MNKNIIILPTALLFVLKGQVQQLHSELRATKIVSVKRMLMRALAYDYEYLALTTKRNYEKSEYYRSLNGAWKFNWVQEPVII